MITFGFKSKNVETLQHWILFADGFSFSPQEFYSIIEREVVSRNIPSMETSRVEFAQGGLLSDKRTYLRMIRERLVLDTCAAPFGDSYFFSCRTVFIPPVIKLWHIIALLFLFRFIYVVFEDLLGTNFGIVALGAFLLAIAQVFQNTVEQGLGDLDSALIKTPIVGPIYERLFRKETYYREDTRLLYLKIMPDLIRELAEDVVADKGVKLVEQFERAPILGELYKPVSPRREPETV